GKTPGRPAVGLADRRADQPDVPGPLGRHIRESATVATAEPGAGRRRERPGSTTGPAAAGGRAPRPGTPPPRPPPGPCPRRTHWFPRRTRSRVDDKALVNSVPTGTADGSDFRVLGPLRVLRAGADLPLGGEKPRTVLALMLMRRNRTVPVSTFAEEVWGRG